ncbi:MAG: hypothetical protein AAFQ84_03655 [Pseudomonadota bacterium]
MPRLSPDLRAALRALKSNFPKITSRKRPPRGSNKRPQLYVVGSERNR